MSTTLRQQSFFRNLNAQMRRQREYINAWNAAFYQDFEWEVYPGVPFGLNEKKTTKVYLERNNIEAYAGYTYTNGHPLSADSSQTSYKINPEYFKLDVKNGPAYYVQQSGGLMISTIYTDGVVVDDGYVDITNSSNTKPGVKITQTGTADSFLVFDQAGDTTPFVINNAGRVGIGVSSPAATLDVRGTTALPALAVNSNNTDSDFQVGSTTTDFMLFGDASTSRIGINTSTPAAALDLVNADTSIPALRITQAGTNPAIYVNTSNNANANFQFASSNSNFMLFGDASTSRIGINTSAPTATLQISGTANLSALVVNANNSDSDFQFGSVRSDYMLFGDAGNSRIGINILNPTATLEISGTANLSALVVNANNSDSDFQFGSTTTDYMLFGDASTSRIGINTSTPTATLEISGAANLSALVVNANNVDSDFQFGSTTTDYMLFGDANNSRIGINTNTPGERLTVKGSVSASDRMLYDTYTVNGFYNYTSLADLTIDASTYSRVRWVAAINSTYSYVVENLTDGREVILYVQSTSIGTTLKRINIRARLTNVGASTLVECSRGGALSQTYVDLSANGGAATVWVANMGGNFVGAIY